MVNDYKKIVSKYFEDNSFMLEIIAQSYDAEPKLESINNAISHVSDTMNLMCLVSSNYHYVNKEDKAAYELALAIKDGLKLYDDERRKVDGEYYIFSESDIESTLESSGFDKETITKRIKNTQLIADQCEFSMDLYQSLFPNYVSPDYISKLYEDNQETLVEKL